MNRGITTASGTTQSANVDTAAKPLPRTRLVSSKHLEGISDLVVAAPIKQGFIDAFESVTYETRLRIAMETLFRMRSNSREFNLLQPLLETTELIQSIRSFRLAIVEIATETKIEKRLVLAVTFDRPWEPYIRLVWNPLGRVLDLLFCNCQHYVPATDHSFADFAQWIRDNQADTGFFYSATNLSVVDCEYLVEIERLHRDSPAAQVEVQAAGLYAKDPSDIAEQVRCGDPIKSDLIALDALGALYRLTSYYPSDRGGEGKYGEGKYLHRAARSLLRGWTISDERLKVHYRDWLEWLDGDFGYDAAYRDNGPADREYDARNVQAGIVTGYDNRQKRPITHGCLLLMHVADPGPARRFVGDLKSEIATEASAPAADPIHLNLAFTHRGLRSLEVPAAILRKFPQEFLEGPEQRAGLIGDVHANHPRRWRLPERNWPPAPRRGRAGNIHVELSEIDIVVQLRTASEHEGDDLFDEKDQIVPEHPLADKVTEIAARAEGSGVRLLSVQPMRSWPVAPEEVPKPLREAGSVTREHFGFLDGFSQPVVGADGTRDCVRRGEVLLGYANDRGDRAARQDDRGGPAAQERAWLDDGSFLVVRKIRQEVGALHEWVASQCNGSGLTEDELYAKMVGRKRDGTPLLRRWNGPNGPNDFDYAGDKTGTGCPLQSHIRRANPRRPEQGRPTPRIMRRGMSYGPRFDPTKPDDAERGIIFMCYQSSIAEQYEPIQRWLNGGNSTGVGAPQNDPLTGVGHPNAPRTFRWLNGQTPVRNKLDDKDKKLFVALEWLLYLFSPSLAGLDMIANDPRRPGDVELDIGDELLIDLGRDLIARLKNGERLLDAVEKLHPLQPVLPGWYHDPSWGDWFRTLKDLLLSSPPLLWAAFKEVVLRRRPKDFEHIGEAARNWKALIEDMGAKDPSERAYGPAVWAAIRTDHGGVIRVPYGDPASGKPIEWVVLVAAKDLAMQVYENENGRYSVEGRGERLERMDRSLGRIYVGLDDGSDYRAESAHTNPILMDVPEHEAFRVARRIADRVLDRAIEAEREIPGGRLPRLDLTNQFITPALAGICTYWFGIPDPGNNYVEPGSWRRMEPDNKFDMAQSSRCPGDFIAPSRYIFYPDPNAAVRDCGQQLGSRLRANVYRMYSAMYRDGRRPMRCADPGRGKASEAPIAARMFESILGERPASKKQDELDREEARKVDLLTRNVIGVMVGMLPPTDGNLRGALYGWLKDRNLWRVQQTLLAAGDGKAESTEADAYRRADKALRGPLMEAMQKRPAPDLLWRTATRRHWLGNVNGKRVKVRKGEKIFVGIASATMEDLGKGEADVYPVFGGERRRSEDERKRQAYPLHACPGYDIAMGTMMGIVSALLEKGTIQPLPAPLMVELAPVAGDATAR